MTTKKPTPAKPSSTRSRKKVTAEPVVRESLPKEQAASNHAIAELAHRLYVERGGAHGRDLDDWLEAERRLRNGN